HKVPSYSSASGLPHARNAKESKRGILMKRLLLVLACVCVLFAATSVAALPRHKSQDTTATVHKSRWSWFHRNKQPREKHAKDGKQDQLHKFPRSIGWWHHQPGPAGAGAK